MKLNIDEITVKIKFIEEKKLKAIISLNFGDFVVKGFRISESEYLNERGEKLWLTPPTYRDGGGRYHPIFFILDKESWKKLNGKIWDEYDKQYGVYLKKRFDLQNEDAF